MRERAETEGLQSQLTTAMSEAARYQAMSEQMGIQIKDAKASAATYLDLAKMQINRQHETSTQMMS